jgi:hypothetical protein
MIKVKGLDKWSTDRLAEFVADLEEQLEAGVPCRTLVAARAELASRAEVNAR